MRNLKIAGQPVPYREYVTLFDLLLVKVQYAGNRAGQYNALRHIGRRRFSTRRLRASR